MGPFVTTPPPGRRCRLPRSLAGLAAGLLVGLVATPSWSAAVAAGAKSVIAEETTPITDTQPSDRVSTIKTADTPPRYLLVFDATKSSDGATVTYKVNGVAKTEDVAVRSVSADNTKALSIVAELFVLAVVLESALAVIFNWRPFIQTFDGRGMKTVISFAFAGSLVALFHFDVVARLLDAYESGVGHQPGLVSEIVTALVIAGGSGGVNTLFQALGLRDPERPKEAVPKPPPGKAWFSVTVKRNAVAGPIGVMIWTQDKQNVQVGEITGTRSPPRVLQYFTRDPMRFPTAGGWSLPQDTECSIWLDYKGGSTEVSPRRTFAPGAVIDFEVSL